MNDFDTVNMNKAQKAVYYLREYGWAYTKNRALKKLGIPIAEETEYMNWLRKHSASKADLERMCSETMSEMPVIDVLIDTTDCYTAGSTQMTFEMRGDASALKKSIKKQAYPGIGKVKTLSEGASLEGALHEMKGDVVVFASADVMFSPELFYQYAKAFADDPKVQMIYTDEDCGTADGKHRMKPYFKPDISTELLCCFQYIGGVFAVKRETLLRLADRCEDDPDGLELTGNGWYDLVFWLVEMLAEEEKAAGTSSETHHTDEKPEEKDVVESGNVSCKREQEDTITCGNTRYKHEKDDISRVHPTSVFHVPQVLFTKLTGAKFEGFYRRLDDQKEYIARHLARTAKKGKADTFDVPGFYHVKYALPEKKPLVSILIPTKDHTDDLDVCVQSILHVNTYRNFEIVLIENNSDQSETFSYYEKILGKAYDPDTVNECTLPEGQKIKIVTWKGEFNYSGINNFGAKAAEGALLLLLNNDTEIMQPDAIEELVSATLLDGVGGAGAMLYYDDDTIQHGGVVYKIGGFAANALWSLTDRDEKYYPYSVTMREMSCVTAACMMLRREAFDAAGGFDEKLCVALNDVDLCLKVRSAGYKYIFNPFAKLHHYESKSRGMETTPEKQERFNREIAYFQEKWQREIDLGDPYYNVNQTLHYANYALELAEDNRGRYKS